MPSEPESSALASVRRWELAGGVWQVVARRGGHLTLALCRCDAGEEVDRLSSAAPDLRAYVGERQSSAD